MDSWNQDFRFALRQLRKSPSFTLISLLALALGIGANTVVFSVVDAVILTPLPYPEPDRLVRIFEDNPSRALVRSQTSGRSYLDFRDMEQVFQNAAVWWKPDVNLADQFGDPMRVETVDISDNFFDVLNVTPIHGRGLRPGEDKLGIDYVAVIGYGLWQRRYGGQESVLGSSITLDGDDFTIIGVAPPGFSYPGSAEVWRSLGWEPEKMNRGARFVSGIGRLAPGVDLEQAQAELSAISKRWQEETPDTNKGWETRIVPLREEWLADVRGALLLLAGAVMMVLLLACFNLANLLLARAPVREREAGIRVAVGAGRGRLIRQFLAEGILLAVLGGIAGIAVAFAGLKLVVAMTPFSIPRLQSATIDGRILVFTFIITTLTGLFFTIIPALKASRPNVQLTLLDSAGLKEGGSGGGRLRKVLVVAEVALAMTLLVGSGLLIRSFFSVLQEESGVNPSQVVTFDIQLPMGSYRQWDGISDFYSQLLERVDGKAGVESVGAAGYLPLERAWRIIIGIRGRPAVPTADAPQAQYRFVSPGYFETMSIPLLQGRLLRPEDDRRSRGVILINETLADQLWPQQDPLGDIVILGTTRLGPLAGGLLKERTFEVVGVVGDVKNNTLEGAVEPAIYFSHRQFPCRKMNILVRGRGQAAQLARTAAQEVHLLDPLLAPSEFRTMDHVLSQALAERRFLMVLLAGFALLAFFLAVVGVYGILSYMVNQRRIEIGIRMAMGAGRSEILRMVTRQGLTLSGIGVVIGTVASILSVGILSSLLHGVESTDPVIFIAVPLIFLTAGWLACYLPARRATSVEPSIAVRPQ